MSSVPCPIIDFDLNLDPDARANSIPESSAASARTLLKAVAAEIPSRFIPLADAARLRTANRFHAETVSFAKRLGVEWRQLLLANLSYDLMLAMIGCSTVALATPSGPVLARNMDWWPEHLLARASAVTRWTRGTNQMFSAAGWPGSIGVVSGVSARGFGLVLNAVSSPEGSNLAGYPMLLFLRRVLEEADHFAAALEWLKSEKLTSSGLITLVGSRNEERVVVERTPSQAVLRYPEASAPLVTTNHYRSFKTNVAADHLGSLAETSCGRFDALTRCADQACSGTEISDAQLLSWLSNSRIAQSITAQHVIIRPADGNLKLWVPEKLLGL